ncbi:LOW QUALITY PROTEIN: phosphoribosylamine-glycine ligase [Geomicrobium sp. JCM 19039]|nr:LOW QUALITY PROTEIN: phosphoribosylamine-glycine ligase [Geomicrobium sp. JCM 19039]
MNILVVGNGGREHVLAWKFAQSKRVNTVYVAPGNPGMEDVATCVTIDSTDHEALIHKAKELDVELTVIGPEAPLAAGIVDAFKEAGLVVFGPSKQAAQIEGSKAFAKDLMHRYEIPTAQYGVFTEFDDAMHYTKEQGAPIVVKADGLAAGKGVTVATTIEEAERALRDILLDDSFGSGAKSSLEEFLEGEEVSILALVNGDTVVPLAESQDHKRAFDADLGPNTGGMGAYSPVPHIDQAQIDRAIETIVLPTAKAMIQESTPFTGVLYAGLMMTADGPKTIEFNARFGDPEAQVVLSRMESDLVDVILAVLNEETPTIEWSDDAVVGVVLAANGYPAHYEKGLPVPTRPSGELFYAGVSGERDGLKSNGGRVYIAIGKADTIQEAQAQAYEHIENLDTNGYHYRRDIAYRAF